MMAHINFRFLSVLHPYPAEKFWTGQLKMLRSSADLSQCQIMDSKLAYSCGPDRLACLTTGLSLPSSYLPESNQYFYPDCALVWCGGFKHS